MNGNKTKLVLEGNAISRYKGFMTADSKNYNTLRKHVIVSSDLDYLYQPAVHYLDLLGSMFACDTPQKLVQLSLQ